MSQKYVQEFCPRMFSLKSPRDTDDATRRQTYVIISNWIHRIGNRDFPTTLESHPIDQKVGKNNKRTLKLSNNMTPTGYSKNVIFVFS